MAKNFRDLTELEILALAVSLEEEDCRIYGDFADGLRQSYPSTAAISFIRHRFMDTPLVPAAVRAALGGALVFLSGLLIGSA
jgi:hypothetical protein